MFYREDALSKWYQVAILSYGPSRCGRDKRPSVYTKVAAYMDWIERNMEP